MKSGKEKWKYSKKNTNMENTTKSTEIKAALKDVFLYIVLGKFSKCILLPSLHGLVTIERRYKPIEIMDYNA